ncbi:MAG: stage V sporulation protein SpoVM [Oscillospiraceae bacterium]|nr:stage V sporulation protein SpoVM [Oscillospiraceae bacterium]
MICGRKDGFPLMKIVVIKSPKLLSGILRMIFKIKKEEDC